MSYHPSMSWKVVRRHKVDKQILMLPEKVRNIVRLLLRELSLNGPTLCGWPNYGKLKGTRSAYDLRHCHLQKGRPTYVACWVVRKHTNEIEVYYVGTHEKAPY